MKIGDQVRFLSESGGGRIVGFQGKGIALVEDEDGFQIPTVVSDLVVVGSDDYGMDKVVAPPKFDTSTPKSSLSAISSKEGNPNGAVAHGSNAPLSGRLEATAVEVPEERQGGDKLSLYLAFVPVNVKEITTTRFECYFVNDSNYYVNFSYLVAEGSNWSLRATMEVEPNTKEFLEEFGREDLTMMEHVAVQAVAYKRGKSFQLKPAIDIQLRIDGVKFYKLHTFQVNDFFDEPALLYTIVENDCAARPLVIDTKQMKASLYTRDDGHAVSPDSNHADGYAPRYERKGRQGNPFVIRRKGDEDVVVKDLHASALLDTTAGMSAGDILRYQIDVFRKTMEQYRSHKGQRIIFIHGKGEGVLRQAVIHELNYRYKGCPYQDASFQEYGYGATQVTIK